MATTRTMSAADDRSGLGLGLIVLVALALIAYVYRDTFASLVSVWQQSETFTHCFAIAPISLYLIWLRRDALAAAPKRVSILGVLAVGLLTLAWFVASSIDIQFGEHLAVVLLIPATVLALLGREATKQIALPLAYLVFMVPFGEALIPWLMDFTSSFTVAALRLTGIPVLREGLFFSIPSGDFEVAKACSGIRYLIACLALGVLYANLTYRSWRKRLAFIAVSIVVPIVGNGVRAYLIVLIAHLSSMKLAVGADHLVYGWLFFGLLVSLLFWAGSRFQDPVPAAGGSASNVAHAPGRNAPLGVHLGVAALLVALAVLGPLAQSGRTAEGLSAALPALVLPVPAR